MLEHVWFCSGFLTYRVYVFTLASLFVLYLFLSQENLFVESTRDELSPSPDSHRILMSFFCAVLRHGLGRVARLLLITGTANDWEPRVLRKRCIHS